MTHTSTHHRPYVPDHGPGGNTATPAAPSPSFLRVANLLLRYRTVIGGIALLSFLAVAIPGLLGGRSYTSEARFMSQARRTSAAGLSGLAAEFGINVGAADGGQSPAFYVDLVNSNRILGEVATDTFAVQTDTGLVRAPLATIWEIEGATPAATRERTVRALRGVVRAVAEQRTGVVTVSVRTKWPGLSQAINRRLIALVNEFNLETRQSQASAERRFTEQRLREVRSDLRAAEERLQQFLTSNRGGLNAPRLAFERERLQRETEAQAQLYLTLAQAYEQAKIEEVRDTPVITVMEAPSLPAMPAPRGVVKRSLLALFVGGTVGLLIALFSAYVRGTRETERDTYEEFVRLRHEAAADVLHPWRPVRRLFTRGT